MGSPQGSDREANRRSDQGRGFNRGSGRGSNRGSRTGQRSNTRTHYSSRGQYIRYCEICKVNGHNNLLFCPKLPEYVPGVSSLTGTKSIPKEICKYCLSTAGHFSTCLHTFPRNYNDWICNQSKTNFVLCRECVKHQAPQDWLKENFNPNLGLGNLYNLWQEFKNDNAIINSVQIEAADPIPENTDNPEVSDHEQTAYVQAVLINNLRIGRACSPFEVIKVHTKSGCYPIVLIYDTGAQVSLCNFETGPLLVGTKQADRRVTISTVESSKAKLRRIHTLNLGDGYQMDAILIPNLRLNLRSIKIPEPWQHYDDVFADQDHYNVKAQILVGADKSTIFPVAELDSNGDPIETDKCRLMRSRITNKLIPFGACEDHQSHDDMMETEAQVF